MSSIHITKRISGSCQLKFLPTLFNAVVFRCGTSVFLWKLNEEGFSERVFAFVQQMILNDG